MPETPHTKIRRRHQNPSALCRSQLMCAKCALQFTIGLRRQLLTPGHQLIAPVKQSAVTQIPPMPFTRQPVDHRRIGYLDRRATIALATFENAWASWLASGVVTYVPTGWLGL